MKKLFLTLLLVSAALAKETLYTLTKEALKRTESDIIKKTKMIPQFANIFAKRLIDKNWEEQGGPAMPGYETALERFMTNKPDSYSKIIDYAKKNQNEYNIKEFKDLVDGEVQGNITLAAM